MGQFSAAPPVAPLEEIQSWDKPYNELSAGTKTEIDRTFRDFKMPFRTTMAEISKSKGGFLVDLRDELRKLYLSVLNIENQQAKLHLSIRPFLDEVKNISKDARICRTTGLQQIKNLSVKGTSTATALMIRDEVLPNKFYVSVADRLTKNLSIVMEGKPFNIPSSVPCPKRQERSPKGCWGTSRSSWEIIRKPLEKLLGTS
jgi:hypothetical protein